MASLTRQTADRQVADLVLRRWRRAGFASSELESGVRALGPRLDSAPAKAMLQEQDAPVPRPRYLVSGWGVRFRRLSDGRKQIFDFILPGEGIGVCLRHHPFANTSSAALTPVRLLDARPLLQREVLDGCKDLALALLAQADADERRALNQIVRLGRLTALERIAHLLVELHERLEVVGLSDGDRFPFPITQETLADATGLSVVHVNRTLQELRRMGLLCVERGWVSLLNKEGLVSLAEYNSPLHPSPAAPVLAGSREQSAPRPDLS